MTDRVVIRARPSLTDAELNALFAASWPDHTTRTFAGTLAQCLTYFGAYVDERLVGFVKVAWDGAEHAFLLDPTVHPAERRRGVGTALVRAATVAAAASGAEWLHVDYVPELHSFYEGAGFRPTAAGLLSLAGRSGITPASFRVELERTPAGERDAWLDVLCHIGEVADDDAVLPRGCVPYLPCPVATVLEAVERAGVTSDDVFVDVGSGAGRTALFVHLLTGAECIGLEIQPALVDAARASAASLQLERIRFVQGDAAELLGSVAVGSVFFLYCPFSGERLDRVLDELEAMARTRQIRLCCVQMPPIDRPWLFRLPATSMELDVYRSKLVLPGREHGAVTV